MAEKKGERKADRVLVESEKRASEEGRLERELGGREAGTISEVGKERESESKTAGESAKRAHRWEGK